MIHVENFFSESGYYIPNQYKVKTSNGIYFQSYNSVIAYIDNGGNVFLDHDWERSNTTGRWRNEFLGENKRATLSKIMNGIYKIKRLHITDD